MIAKNKIRHIDTNKNVVSTNDVENGIAHFDTLQQLFDLHIDKRSKVVANVKSYNLIDYNDNTLNILVTNGTSVGLTTVTNSVNTVKGAVSVIKSANPGIIASSNYLKNVTMFAKLVDGTYKQISIYNAMQEGDFTFAAKPKAENEHALELIAHHDPTDSLADLYEIKEVSSI
jgi:hypothetical protein